MCFTIIVAVFGGFPFGSSALPIFCGSGPRIHTGFFLRGVNWQLSLVRVILAFWHGYSKSSFSPRIFAPPQNKASSRLREHNHPACLRVPVSQTPHLDDPAKDPSPSVARF